MDISIALVVTNSAGEPRAFSIGPLKMQLLNFAVASGDTSGTFVADKLSTILFTVPVGLTLTSQPVDTGNSIALAFADPLATVVGKILVLGR